MVWGLRICGRGFGGYRFQAQSICLEVLPASSGGEGESAVTGCWVGGYLCLVYKRKRKRRFIFFFFKCELARIFWFGSPLQLDVGLIQGEEFQVYWENIVTRFAHQEHEHDVLQMPVFGLWVLWKTWNRVVFEGMGTEPSVMVDRLLAQVGKYLAAMKAAKPLLSELP